MINNHSIFTIKNFFVLFLTMFFQVYYPIAAWSQASDSFIGFTNSEFDKIIIKNRFIKNENKIIIELNSFFKNYCNSKNLKSLINKNFNCKNRICYTSRTIITKGYYVSNIIIDTYKLQVKLGNYGCPTVNLEIKSKFLQGK